MNAVPNTSLITEHNPISLINPRGLDNGEKIPIQKDGGARRSFQGLKWGFGIS